MCAWTTPKPQTKTIPHIITANFSIPYIKYKAKNFKIKSLCTSLYYLPEEKQFFMIIIWCVWLWRKWDEFCSTLFALYIVYEWTLPHKISWSGSVLKLTAMFLKVEHKTNRRHYNNVYVSMWWCSFQSETYKIMLHVVRQGKIIRILLLPETVKDTLYKNVFINYFILYL